MKRTEKTLQVLHSILEKAENGHSVTLDTENNAINLRQRFYTYRKAINRENTDHDLIDKLSRLTIAVEDKTVHFSIREPDYIENFDDED